MYQNMYEYYENMNISPTYGGFKSWDDLTLYEWERRKLFEEKLYLPTKIFKNSRLIEFGPDSGENSLVFAMWDANCTLVEPNEKAHEMINHYFKKFKLSHKLHNMSRLDLKTFSEQTLQFEKYDIIDAEGFIYTVKPDSLWINFFYQLLQDDGFIILFYSDGFGSFLELFLKVIFTRFKLLTGMSSVESAEKLFRAKWDSIHHKRSIESWVMDVLESPFVRLRNFYELKTFFKQMKDAGLYLYSSWPPYKDELSVYWFKKLLSSDQQMNMLNDFITRSRISHMFGREHFLLINDTSIEEMLWELITLIDGLIDNFNSDQANECVEYLSELEKIFNTDMTFSKEQDIAVTLKTIYSIKYILHLLKQGGPTDLIEFCNNDQPFIQSWGMPSQFAVFRKEIQQKQT